MKKLILGLSLATTFLGTAAFAREYSREPIRADHDRGRDNDRDRGYNRDRGYDRDRGYGRDRGYDRDRGHDRDRWRDDRRRNDQIFKVRCGSRGYNYNECFVSGFGRMDNLRLERQRSDARCSYGSTYGITRDGRSIWVDRGCEGDFLAYFY